MSHTVLVRGAGDLASGVILRLHQCGFRVLCTECAQPSAIRRRAAFCDAVYDNAAEVEGVLCRRAINLDQIAQYWSRREIPLIVDEPLACLEAVRPAAVVDAILAKRNLGTHRAMAPITIGLGPGFVAGADVDAVIETMRGHNLGRVLYTGEAQANTGVPGLVGGESSLRVIYAPATGAIIHCAEIGDLVTKGQTIAMLGNTPVTAGITGVLRGLIRQGYPVRKGLKIADIDPRTAERENCFSVSDKARCIAGGVVEALLRLGREREVTLL